MGLKNDSMKYLERHYDLRPSICYSIPKYFESSASIRAQSSTTSRTLISPATKPLCTLISPKKKKTINIKIWKTIF